MAFNNESKDTLLEGGHFIAMTTTTPMLSDSRALLIYQDIVALYRECTLSLINLFIALCQNFLDELLVLKRHVILRV